MKKAKYKEILIKPSSQMIEVANSTVLRIFVSFLVVFAILICSLYLINFYSSPLSGDPANWGQFGDYIGGVLNPLLAVTNLIVFVFLNNKIQRQEERNIKENIRIQKEISDENKQLNKDIALMQMRREELHYFTIEMDRDFSEWKTDPSNKFTMKKLKDKLLNFQSRLGFLFPVLIDSIYLQTLLETITKLESTHLNTQPVDILVINAAYSNLVNSMSQKVVYP